MLNNSKWNCPMTHCLLLPPFYTFSFSYGTKQVLRQHYTTKVFKFSPISCYLWLMLYPLRRHNWTKTKPMNQQTRINRRVALFPKKLSAKNSMIARNFVFCSNYSAIKLVNIIFSLFSLAAKLQTYGKLVWHPLSKKTTKPLVKTVKKMTSYNTND